MKLLKGSIYCAMTVLLALLTALWAPGFWGYQMYYVSSGSMEPEIMVGDLILVKEINFDELETGNIITYSLNQGKTQITHRIIQIDKEKKMIKTKGDANDMEDASWVREKEVTGVVSFHIRKFGALVCLLSTLSGKLLIIAVFMWLMAMSVFLDRLSLKQKRKEMCCYK